MTDDKWLDTIATVKEKFGILEQTKTELSKEQGRGEVEKVIFNSPLGRMKFERIVRPVVLDKKTIGSKRMGSHATVEYIYSDTEKTAKFKAYKWDEAQDAWVEMEKMI